MESLACGDRDDPHNRGAFEAMGNAFGAFHSRFGDGGSCGRTTDRHESIHRQYDERIAHYVDLFFDGLCRSDCHHAVRRAFRGALGEAARKTRRLSVALLHARRLVRRGGDPERCGLRRGSRPHDDSAGFHPAIAGAAIIGSITPSTLSPGSSHNVWIAKIAEMDVMDLIVQFAPEVLTMCALNIVLVTAMVFVFRDYKRPQPGEDLGFSVVADERGQLPEHPSMLRAVAPILPVVLLMLGATVVPQIRMSVAEAMVYGSIYTLLITRSNPQTVTKEFFGGMGKGYANIMGIIIAAGCFAGGLRACGVIDSLIETLKHSNDIARYAANFGPFVMGVLTGSGDAAGHAFNQAVTPYAADFGMKIENLGMVAALSGAFGRMCSPIAGATIVIAGMTKLSPLDVAKRMAIPMLVNLVLLGFVFEL